MAAVTCEVPGGIVILGGVVPPEVEAIRGVVEGLALRAGPEGPMFFKREVFGVDAGACKWNEDAVAIRADS